MNMLFRKDVLRRIMAQSITRPAFSASYLRVGLEWFDQPPRTALIRSPPGVALGLVTVQSGLKQRANKERLAVAVYGSQLATLA